MQTYRSLRLTVILAVFGLALAARPAHAGTVTLTGPANITLPEDGSAQLFSYTLTNTSGAPIFFNNLGPGHPLFYTFGLASGDPTDIAGFTWGVNYTFPSSLGDGDSFIIQLFPGTTSGTGETDADSGAHTTTFGIGFMDVTGATGSASQDVTITVTDPAIATPEPSSLLLLGSGLAVFSGLRRRLSLFR